MSFIIDIVKRYGGHFAMAEEEFGRIYFSIKPISSVTSAGRSDTTIFLFALVLLLVRLYHCLFSFFN